MKFQTTKDNLLKGLHIVERAVGKNSTLPIIENILLKTEESGLRLTATNLELGVSTWIPIKVEEEGEITVTAKRFVTYIQNLPDNKLNISTTKKSLDVNSDSGKASFIAEDAKEFPPIPEVKGEMKLDLPSKDIRKMLNQTVGATSQTETRPELSGVYWLIDTEKAEESMLSIVATDSYRLAERTLKVSKIKLDNPENNNFIIPKQTAVELERLIDEADEKMTVLLDENQVSFNIGKTTKLVSRLIEGMYPNYKAIIPESHQCQLTTSTGEFRDAVNRISLFSSEKTQEVKVTLDPKGKKVTVSASSGETGTGDTHINTTGKEEGDKIEFNVNYRYLVDGLSWLDDEEVKVEAQDSAKPVVLRQKNNDNYLYLIMPLRR